jgi:hypothetical protein
MPEFGALARFTRRYHLCYHFRSSNGASPKEVEDAKVHGSVANPNRPVLVDSTGLLVDAKCVHLNINHDENSANLLHEARLTTETAFSDQNITFERIVAATLPPSPTPEIHHTNPSYLGGCWFYRSRSVQFRMQYLDLKAQFCLVTHWSMPKLYMTSSRCFE